MILKASNLAIRFGQTVALRDADVAISPGEIVAIMGPSGSGKSTLLHVLAGILRPEHGEVHLDEQRIDNLSDSRRSRLRLRSFGFVLQFGDLVPELSLRENVELPLRLLSAPRAEARTRSRELLRQLEVDDLADRRPGQVSGGQAQRAAVARALVHRPSVIFADEPTGALDSAAGEVVLDALTGLARKEGSAVVMVTHEARVAAYADRTVFLRDGRVAA
ncbi:ATP-binding cassette domain-containing protein [Plantactinospora sp. S1510]|uniref:ATP-binding cassette domain-containing protein n=1 Tax=Plantactinospora alkalitolerans TaxID=2789879 RepID=A0ABS0GXJ6_9ACTN|nr:ATP-binding cassette domain-containing protein [Plantactinospora alkalitolerans]MBF9130927.1 ATP-binding cassette domain-containing protein [Plantactinospora alkalitolerans]